MSTLIFKSRMIKNENGNFFEFDYDVADDDDFDIQDCEEKGEE